MRSPNFEGGKRRKDTAQNGGRKMTDVSDCEQRLESLGYILAVTFFVCFPGKLTIANDRSPATNLVPHFPALFPNLPLFGANPKSKHLSMFSQFSQLLLQGRAYVFAILSETSNSMRSNGNHMAYYYYERIITLVIFGPYACFLHMIVTCAVRTRNHSGQSEFAWVMIDVFVMLVRLREN